MKTERGRGRKGAIEKSAGKAGERDKNGQRESGRESKEDSEEGRSERGRGRTVSTCSNSFGVSLEEARQKEGDREQNKSNQGIFRRRDVWPKSISTPSLRPALSRRTISAQA